MFKNLTNFSYKRNWKEAIGFYLSYLLLFIILGVIISVLIDILSGANTFDQGLNIGLKVGMITSIIFCVITSGLLLKEKKLFKNFWYIFLVLLSGILAYFGGSLFGLIIPAFITTKQSK